MKKRAYLFLALLLPGLVFVFLKYFGSNRFDIPVYYTDSAKVAPWCPAAITPPYVLPDSVWNYFPGHKTANVAVLGGDTADVKEGRAVVKGELGEKVTIRELKELSPDAGTCQKWITCVFLAEKPGLTVLFDDLGRIRGYYDLGSRDEVDRLRVELKILLEQY